VRAGAVLTRMLVRWFDGVEIDSWNFYRHLLRLFYSYSRDTNEMSTSYF